MIKLDIISWLVDIIEDCQSLSEYSLEYATALLNLSLRYQGKLKCAACKDILNVLNDLLEYPNTTVSSHLS